MQSAPRSCGEACLSRSLRRIDYRDTRVRFPIRLQLQLPILYQWRRRRQLRQKGACVGQLRQPAARTSTLTVPFQLPRSSVDVRALCKIISNGCPSCMGLSKPRVSKRGVSLSGRIGDTTRRSASRVTRLLFYVTQRVHWQEAQSARAAATRAAERQQCASRRFMRRRANRLSAAHFALETNSGVSRLRRFLSVKTKPTTNHSPASSERGGEDGPGCSPALPALPGSLARSSASAMPAAPLLCSARPLFSAKSGLNSCFTVSARTT